MLRARAARVVTASSRAGYLLDMGAFHGCLNAQYMIGYSEQSSPTFACADYLQEMWEFRGWLNTQYMIGYSERSSPILTYADHPQET